MNIENLKGKAADFLRQDGLYEQFAEKVDDYRWAKKDYRTREEQLNDHVEGLKEIIDNIDDSAVLKECWRKVLETNPDNFSNDSLEYALTEAFEKKAIQLVLLPIGGNIFKLACYADGKDDFQYPGIDLRTAAQDMATELMNGVTPQNIPDWFVKMLNCPKSIPYFLKGDFKDKAKKITLAL